MHRCLSKLLALIGAICAVGMTSVAHAEYFEVSVPPTGTDKYISADYRMWIPEKLRTIRGVILKQHGCGDPAAEHSLDHANDLQWQALARRHGCVLISTRLLTGDKPCSNWCDPENGSGAAFLKAIDLLAEKSRHAELRQAPWALWGHSGGADWVTGMLRKYPERVVAAVPARGGLAAEVPDEALHVPVLWALGELDWREVFDGPKRDCEAQRRKGAPWTLAIEANTHHETSDTRLLAIPYLDAALTARLPKRTGDPLRPMDTSHAWLGDPETHRIAPEKDYAGDKLAAAWLPNEDVARRWQEYVTTGKITRWTPEAAPQSLTASWVSDHEVKLSWRYPVGHLMNLPTFNIYRNGDKIGVVRGQQHDYGDAASPAQVALEYVDSAPSRPAHYWIRAVNALGEGDASGVVEPRGK